MATEIYRCPVTQSLHLVSNLAFFRIRPNELFAIDSVDSATIADILAQGVDIGPLDPVTENVSFNNPDHAHAHNPFSLDD